MKKFKKALKPIVAAAAVIFLLWGAVFFTDFNRTANLKEPVFAKPYGASGTMATSLKGIGYRVDIEYYFDENGNRSIEQISMYLFGKLVAAAIT